MAKSQTYLKSIIKKIKWGTESELPFSQGWAIREVQNRYAIPAKKWGYSGSAIGLETNKQYLLWRDLGGELEFLGLVNK